MFRWPRNLEQLQRRENDLHTILQLYDVDYATWAENRHKKGSVIRAKPGRVPDVSPR